MPDVRDDNSVPGASLLTPEDSRFSLARGPWPVARAIAVDGYYFLALIAFLVLMWPILLACHYVDGRCGTRSTERLVRFCERF